MLIYKLSTKVFISLTLLAVFVSIQICICYDFLKENYIFKNLLISSKGYSPLRVKQTVGILLDTNTFINLLLAMQFKGSNRTKRNDSKLDSFVRNEGFFLGTF